MPLGMFVAWCAGKSLGTSEWQLRAVNLLWVGLSGAAFGLIGKMYQSRSFFALGILSPFLWYYANEARPYALLICLGAWLLYFLLRLERQNEVCPRALTGLAAVSVLGFAVHALFGFVILGVAAAALPRLTPGRRQIRWRHIRPVVTGAILLAVVAFYYMWTLKRGASGAKLWSVGFQNAAFSIYELLGFGGLGPPRHELREIARQGGSLFDALLNPAYIGLAVLVIVYAIIAIQLVRTRPEPDLRAGLIVTVTAIAGLFAAAALARFPFWGRHLAGLLPFVLFIAWRVTTTRFRGTSKNVILSFLF
ncbi:MAG TPA: hypothetical protein VK530_04835, partial [Candidatus Acidoferrum sp.]|nr:hypothetical protein [Candidatus Acidoferrum sp.]